MTERKHRGQHTDCFACKVQTVRLSPSATPTRRRPTDPARQKEPRNSWERGIVTDDRGMPVLDGGELIGVKEWANKRSDYERRLKRAKHPQPQPVRS